MKKIAVLTLLLASSVSFAQVKVTLKASKISKEHGTEVRTSADRAKPGDEIEYAAEYRNPEKDAVHKVMATLPVPAGMEYIPGSADPQQVMASTDGANFAPLPLMRTVKTPDGRTVQQQVPVSEYRSLRWSLNDIAGNSAKTVKARMKIQESSNTPH